ncbi:hypothetical protein JCM10908_006246 [Rhodotorula pacifica]|uniref:F-box protein n=1 Tax=Rhodotorula pacifica TaxID=1495444 RepID=UPI00318068AA
MASQRTSLLSLPDELLVRIFDELRNNYDWLQDLHSAMFVCRRLYPAAQTALYHDVEFSDWKSANLQRFAESLANRPELGQLVTAISMYIGTLPDDLLVEHRGLITKLSFVRALSRLKKLHIFVTGSSDGVPRLFSELQTPSLRDVSVLCRVTSANREGWYAVWASLQGFPDLHTLHLSMTNDLLDAPAARRVKPLPQVRTSHIDADFVTSIFGVEATIASLLPNLTDLEYNRSKNLSAADASRTLANLPPSLEKLDIHSYEMPALTGYFKALPPLKHLALYRSAYVESELLAYLPTSRLESISFDLFVDVTDRVLYALTEATNRPRSLRRIHSDSPHSGEGTEVHLDLKELSDPSDDAIDNVYANNCPDWREGCSEEGLRAAIAAAEAAGIEFEGGAVQAVDWDELFDDEVLDFLMEDARPKDDYDRVIERFGEDEVFEWLEVNSPNAFKIIQRGLRHRARKRR